MTYQRWAVESLGGTKVLAHKHTGVWSLRNVVFAAGDSQVTTPDADVQAQYLGSR